MRAEQYIDSLAVSGGHHLTTSAAIEAIGAAPVTRAQFEANMAAKLTDPSFLADVPPLLRTGLEYDAAAAWSRVHAVLVSRLPGGPCSRDGAAS